MAKKRFLTKLKEILSFKFLRNSRLFSKSLPKIRTFFKKMIKKTGQILKKIFKKNSFRLFREKMISRYLSRVVSLKDKQLLITWQPLLWILIKLGVVGYLSYRFYQIYPLLAGWLSDGLAFFRLDEIYNFKFPDKVFFIKISKYLILFVIGYYGLFFLYQQIRALFSALIVHKGEQKLFYIDNSLLKKKILIFSIPEIDLIVLGQNLFFRPFRLGNIMLYKRNGEKIVIASLSNAPAVTRAVTEIKRVGESAGQSL